MAPSDRRKILKTYMTKAGRARVRKQAQRKRLAAEKSMEVAAPAAPDDADAEAQDVSIELGEDPGRVWSASRAATPAATTLSAGNDGNGVPTLADSTAMMEQAPRSASLSAEETRHDDIQLYRIDIIGLSSLDLAREQLRASLRTNQLLTQLCAMQEAQAKTSLAGNTGSG